MKMYLRAVVAVMLPWVLFSPAWGLVKKPAEVGTEQLLSCRYPVITAPLLKTPPKIDGVVDKAEWTSAAQSLPFIVMETGVGGADAAVCWIGYTRDGVYVAFRFARPAYADKPLAKNGPDQVWGDDCMELFLRPKFGAREEYTFLLNSLGVKADGFRRGNTDKRWTCPWQGAARQTDDGYEGELFVPFASLGVETPKPGETWEMLVSNTRVTPTKETATHSFLRYWKALEDFGYLVFGDESTPAVRPLEAGALTTGEAGMLIELLGHDLGKYNITARLYRPLTGGQKYFDILEADANPLGAQLEGKEREFVPVDRVIAKTLSKYELVKQWSQTEQVALDQTRRVPMVMNVPVGEYVLQYVVTEAGGGRVIAGATLPFAQLPPFVMKVEPYLLMAQVLAVDCDYRRVADLSQDSKVVAELLDRESHKVLAKDECAVDHKGRRSVLHLSTRNRLGGSYDVRTRLTSGERVIAEQALQAYHLPAAPEWWGNDLGKPEKLGIVPSPWTPIVARHDGFDVWGRQVQLDGMLMPVQIVHTQTPMTGQPRKPEAMLAGAATLELAAGGKPMTVGAVKTLEAKPWLLTRQVQLGGTGAGEGVTGTLRLDVEFDGLMKYTLDLAPTAGGATVDKVILEIPLPSANARYYNHGYTSTLKEKINRYASGVLTAQGLKLPFTEKLWVGNLALGMDFVCERDRWWAPMDSPQATQVLVKGGATVMRIEMVAAPRELDSPVQYQWAILPTPAKPMNEELNHRLFLVQTGVNYDQATGTIDAKAISAQAKALVAAGANATHIWAHGFNVPNGLTPSLWNPDHAMPSLNPAVPNNDLRSKLLRQVVDLYRQAGMRWMMLYMMWEVPTSWPNQHGVFWTEMASHPLSPSVHGYLFEPTPVFADWYLWEMARSIRELDIDSTYQDSTCHRMLSTNPYTGSGWYDDQGQLRGTYVIFQNRELHKRIWVLLHHQLKNDGIVYAHDSHMIMPAITSFVDVHHCGEGSTIRNRDEFVGKFYGYPFGQAVTFTRWNNPAYPEKRMHSWRTALMLDIDIKATPVFVLPNEATDNGMGRQKLFKGYDVNSIVVADLWEAWRKYPWAGSIWISPWEASSFVQTGQAELVPAMHYNKGKAAMISVSNFTDKQIDAAVKVDWSAIGLDPQTARINDVVTKEPIKCVGGAIPLKVLDWRWRMVYIEAAK